MKICSECFAVNSEVNSWCVHCGALFGPVVSIKPINPTTQKATGLHVLKGAGYHATPILSLFPVKAPIDPKIVSFLGPILKNKKSLFCRPCPPTPQHGFVESRIVKDIASIEAVRLETLAVCPEAEIMLVESIDAKWNIIWTPTMLAIGPGHDGATSGKGAISIPLVGTKSIPEGVLKAALIGPDKSPYIEAVVPECPVTSVYNYANTILTQLRAGPALEGASIDVIPGPLVVQEVIKTAGEDLLEWQNKMPLFKSTPGLVIWHPSGTPVDHYSVHCREHGVPIMISREPIIGETMAPTSSIAPLDPYEVLRGLATIDHTHLRVRGEYTILALLALHNSAVLRGPHSFWIGVGIGAILKLGSAALRGEARHAHNCAHGGKQRPDVHDFYSSLSLSQLRAGLSRTTQILYWGFGNPDGSHGYGGPKWGYCGAALVPLFNAVRNLAQYPSPEAASEALLALNMAINQAHNGGWWLNKFVDASAYTQVPAGKLAYLLGAPNAIMEAATEKRATDSQLAKFISRVQSWPETTIEPLKWRHASVDVTPAGLVINLKAATVPTPKVITVPMAPRHLKALIKNKSSVVIEPRIIRIDTPEGSLSVWEEPTIEARQQLGKTVE